MILSGVYGCTLADLYTSLSRVNEQLETAPRPSPLTTSRLSNICGNEKSFKARQSATWQKRQLEVEQRSIRVLIDLQSRYGIRPLHIYDLPEELLSEIFVHLRGAAYVEEASGLGTRLYCTKDVKNARLVSQRFCRASSHLLLSFIKIDVTPKSVERLCELSLHPVFRKTLRDVKIRMNVYNEEMSYNIQNFAAYNIGQIRKEIRRLDGLREWNNRYDKEIKKANLILDAWTPIAEGYTRPIHAGDEKHIHYELLLREAHNEYKERMMLQNEILGDGSFIRDVNVAIARMPMVSGLQMCGGSWFDNVRINFGILKSDDVLRQSLLLSMTLQEHRLQRNVTPHTLVHGFPGALLQQMEFQPSWTGRPGATRKHCRSRLQKITLSNLSLSQYEIETVLQAWSLLDVRITLKSINLDGSWASVLDVLRGFPRSQWYIDDPFGSECDVLSNEEKKTIFGNPRSRASDGPSLAECFIAGIPGYTNPLRFDEDDSEE